jgi:formylglycine-generating enzyme required for sulfatase activity
MTRDTQKHNMATIRQLLLAAFTPEELRRFCFDHPTFRPVVNRFGPGHGLDDMVDEIITHCESQFLLPELLAELKALHPRQYARFIEPDLPEDQPAQPTPEILTLSSPISLHLVRVPAGEFRMGSIMATDQDAEDDELPPHTVYVPEFRIAKYPVTNAQYQVFVQATGHRAPSHWEKERMPWLKENHPVNGVSWESAIAFCTWLNRETGQPFRLPTEAEWEKAARGTDGRLYPWGNEPPDKDRCNLGENVGETTPIGRYSPQGDSPYGCADMAGNVWEWCQSLYRPYTYHSGDGREDLKAGGPRVVRGGSFSRAGRGVRCASRGWSFPHGGYRAIGFRVCVASGQLQP